MQVAQLSTCRDTRPWACRYFRQKHLGSVYRAYVLCAPAQRPGNRVACKRKTLFLKQTRVCKFLPSSYTNNSESGETTEATLADKVLPSDPQEVEEEARLWNPNRWRIAQAMSLAFVLCNMDKVNMSVAIIPLAKEFDWSASDKGLVGSAFFWGYTLTQIPGGLLAKSLGGATVLAGAVALWSFGTLVTPVAAYLPAGAFAGICAARFTVGLGEGVSPPASAALMVQHMKPEERARAVSLVFGGMDVGNVIGLLVAPVLIETFGVSSVFYLFAGIGFLWVVGWPLALGKPMDALLSPNGLEVKSAPQAPEEREDIPWGEFVRSPPVWAVICTHFCNNWGYYTLLAWLPSYFEGGLGQDLSASTYLSLLPYLAMAGMNVTVGPTADYLVQNHLGVTTVRKLAQSTAFLVPAACNLALACFTPEDPSQLSHPTALYVGLLSLAFAASAWSRAGLYCNHQDLSPKYASVLLGLSNTAGAVPGVVGVWFAGYLLDVTGGSWANAVFLPSMAFQLLGAAVFIAFGSAERQSFDTFETVRGQRRRL